MITITSRNAENIEMYPDSVVDNTTSFCVDLFHKIGHPAYIMLNYVQE